MHQLLHIFFVARVSDLYLDCTRTDFSTGITEGFSPSASIYRRLGDLLRMCPVQVVHSDRSNSAFAIDVAKLEVLP